MIMSEFDLFSNPSLLQDILTSHSIENTKNFKYKETLCYTYTKHDDNQFPQVKEYRKNFCLINFCAAKFKFLINNPRYEEGGIIREFLEQISSTYSPSPTLIDNIYNNDQHICLIVKGNTKD